MKAVDIMTRAVVTVAPNASIVDAMRLMLGQRISGLPVTDASGQLVGLLTEGDLLRRAETGTEKSRPRWLQFLRGPARQAQDYVQTHGRKVEEIMTRDVLTVTEGAPLEEAVELMEKRHVKRLPVIADGRLVGVVSRADLLRALVQELGKITPATPSDAALREQVVIELRGQAWSGRSHVTVVATEGIVYLEGSVFDERERNAIRVVAENVTGVKEVRDHLDYFDPHVGLMYGF
jgi:CBS-domain-containing membrane protein